MGSSTGPINAKGKLEEYVGKRDDIQKAIEDEWGRHCARISIVIAINSLEKRAKDEAYVKEKRQKNIFLWSAKDIAYIDNLIKQVGSAAKFQLFSVIFADKRQKALKEEYPAIKGKIGNNEFYTFMISAKELIKYAYVHHRDLTGIVEVSQVYQRMLKDAKLKGIAKFIDEESGYFPNSIIVNFSKQLNWSLTKRFKNDISMGTITLPKYYGCAWIIDGQHRLYGAARAVNDVLVPVLAFKNIDTLEQANLFVEINEKQTSVPKNLMWDLYSDIYRDSADDKQRLQYQIAETAKRLRTSGPLSPYIDIPSKPVKGPPKLSLTTICSTIEKYAAWENLKHPTDETRTPDNAARLINCYYEVLKELWPKDWQKGKDSVLLSNNGFGVFIMVFQDIVKYIIQKKDDELLRPHREKDFKSLLRDKFLTPVIEYLKDDNRMAQAIRSKGGRGPQSANAAFLDLKIHLSVGDYCPTRMDLPPEPQPSEEQHGISALEEKARLAEKCLRIFVLHNLKSNYGSKKWWKQGLTNDAKTKADEHWKREISDKPYLRDQKEDTNERKFEYLGLGDLMNIVLYGENWPDIFEPVFIKKLNFQNRMKQIDVLRNPTTHKRKFDDLDVLDGTAGLLWLSNCIGDTEINPYL